MSIYLFVILKKMDCVKCDNLDKLKIVKCDSLCIRCYNQQQFCKGDPYLCGICYKTCIGISNEMVCDDCSGYDRMRELLDGLYSEKEIENILERLHKNLNVVQKIEDDMKEDITYFHNN